MSDTTLTPAEAQSLKQLPVPSLVEALVHDITGWRLVLPLMVLSVIASAIGVVYSKHVARGLTNQWEQTQVVRDKLEVEWRNLRLEQSAMAEHSRVEEIAREKLRMVPVVDEMQEVVQPEQRMASNAH
ncbi:MAG: cell division protein FtsL [Gammaproteobacteria bacterium]|nr:cell division protein FtsL [Gammaproteobacteria bacterium]